MIKDHLIDRRTYLKGLGASLARMEARILGEVLQSRGLTLNPVGTPTRVDSTILRGFTTYPVSV